MMRLKRTVPLRLAVLAPLATAVLMACGGGGGGFPFVPAPTPAPAPPETACAETGPYACKSGETEPLYTFQWALNYAKSWFTDNADAGAYGGGIDLNVEPVHRQGYKGQGVNVLVVDSGVDLAHEDLRDNADLGMSWNFETDMPDPAPRLTGDNDPHGTNVAGIIGAAQNGKGVMGIAPRVRIGGAAIVTGNDDIWTQANFTSIFGGAPWSRNVHVINGSYGGDAAASAYALAESAELAGVRGLKSLRDGKGIVFVKAAGNAFGLFTDDECGPLTGAYDCTNPGNDNTALEPNVIVTAALNAKGQAASYSSSGSVVWITGLAGEFGSSGRYGEKSRRSPDDIAAGATGDGPVLFSTDISGCDAGYSRSTNAVYPTQFLLGKSELRPGLADNAHCDYSYMNGTSAAAPSISAVVALVLSANPALSWRDVRDILRLSARQVDPGYEQRVRNDGAVQRTLPYNALFDLRTNRFVNQGGGAQHIMAGATQVPVELGWLTNGAGLRHSNWYGFGVPDAAKAVELALLYKKDPSRSRSAVQVVPAFATVAEVEQLRYQQVQLIGEFDAAENIVDQVQLRVSGNAVCLGSLGLVVESPSGVKSWLKLPLDHFAFEEDAMDEFRQYGAGSYAFYGENARGPWKVYAVMSNPTLPHPTLGTTTCEAAPGEGETVNPDAKLLLEARIISQ